MKIILLGPPGSGKGTVSENLVKDFSAAHISPGEILREEVSKETTLGIEIKKYIEKGNLVPNQFIVEIIKLEIIGKKDFILDGFPRSLDQAEAIKDIPLDVVLYLDVPEKVVIERFSGRRTCSNNHGYHIKYLPPKKEGLCDIDGLPLSKRKDDKPDIIKERFRVYHKNTAPLVEYYKKKGLLISVDASPAPEKVYAEVKKALKKISKK
ncbi:nucleoside monophosphate kinase [Candidatus Woesearchaeota archaeon]|nr:nucleoside monophosphate kinase [Candidatus Woesearchaeota archaeon]